MLNENYFNYFKDDNYISKYVYNDSNYSNTKEDYENLGELVDELQEKVKKASANVKRAEKKLKGLWKRYCNSEDNVSEMLELYANYYDEDYKSLRKKIFSMNTRDRSKKLRKIFHETIYAVEENYEDIDAEQYAVFLKTFKLYKKLNKNYKVAKKRLKKASIENDKIYKKWCRARENYWENVEI